MLRVVIHSCITSYNIQFFQFGLLYIKVYNLITFVSTVQALGPLPAPHPVSALPRAAAEPAVPPALAMESALPLTPFEGFGLLRHRNVDAYLGSGQREKPSQPFFLWVMISLVYKYLFSPKTFPEFLHMFYPLSKQIQSKVRSPSTVEN